MSFYVRRTHGDRTGWTGPIRSERQVAREANAWRSIGWDAEVVPSSPQTRAQVRAWERRARTR